MMCLVCGPLHGLCGAWGGIAAGVFGLEALGGMGGVTFMSQVAGTVIGVSIAFGWWINNLRAY